jgi:2-polyprenyl-6-methoxyphenol hydroxylase-like FAD-dependent oxidoreductase
LFESLRKSAEGQGVQIISNAKVQSITPHSPTQAIVNTEAGEEYSAALVVVADGSKSPHGHALGLRRAGFQYSHEAIFITGELDNLRQNRLIQRKEGNRLTGLLPIGAGQASFFWGLSQDDPFLSGSQFEREANSLIPEASKLIRKLSASRSITRVGYRCSIHYPWYFNNIVLLGDAAHAMTPHLGQGASLALQDAQSLAKAIGQKQGKLEDALNDYQKERFFITSYYSLVSSLSAPYFQSDFSALGAPGNLALKSLKRIAGLERLMLSTMSGFGPMLKNLERGETTNSFSSSPI